MLAANGRDNKEYYYFLRRSHAIDELVRQEEAENLSVHMQSIDTVEDMGHQSQTLYY